MFPAFRVLTLSYRILADLTGEENEIVESGLKGVKLFIKHGSREFTDGLIGHVKLLSSKDSESGRLRESTSTLSAPLTDTQNFSFPP